MTPSLRNFFFPKSIDETSEAFRLFDNQSSSKFSRAKVTDEGEISEGEQPSRIKLERWTSKKSSSANGDVFTPFSRSSPRGPYFFPAPSSLDLTRNIVAVPSGFWEFITIVKPRS